LQTRTTTAFASLVFSLIAACGDTGDTVIDEAPLFPEDATSTYREVRDCRRSGDHDLNHVRIVVNDIAHDVYRDRNGPFPEGSLIVKVEYADPECTDVVGFTSMRRDPAGTSPGAGDWRWQRLDANRKVLRSGEPAECVSCHASCGVPPDGHDWTCAAP
jgi:hypothetical protein